MRARPAPPLVSLPRREARGRAGRLPVVTGPSHTDPSARGRAGRPALGTLGILAALALAACQGAEPVTPFPDAGNPCAAASPGHASIDCARFSNLTCVADAGGGCAVTTYGCVDAAFFTAVDASACALDGQAGD